MFSKAQANAIRPNGHHAMEAAITNKTARNLPIISCISFRL